MASRESQDDPFAGLTDAERAELEAAAAITPEDILKAQEAWREQASPAFRDLLDAAPDDGTTDSEGGA